MTIGKLIDDLARINEELRVPTPAAFGIDPGEWEAILPLMAEQALASGSPGNNPVVPDAGEIQALYRRAWNH